MSEVFHLTSIQMFNVNFESLWQLDHNCPSVFVLFLYTVKSGQFSTSRRLNIFSKWHNHGPYALCTLPLIVLKELISAQLLWTGLKLCVDLIPFFTRNTGQSRRKTMDPHFLVLEKDHSTAPAQAKSRYTPGVGPNPSCRNSLSGNTLAIIFIEPASWWLTVLKILIMSTRPSV